MKHSEIQLIIYSIKLAAAKSRQFALLVSRKMFQTSSIGQAHTITFWARDYDILPQCLDSRWPCAWHLERRLDGTAA